MQLTLSNYTQSFPEIQPDQLETETKELLKNNQPKKAKHHLYMIWVKDTEGRLTATWTLQD